MTFAELYQQQKQAGNVRSYRQLAGEISAVLAPHDSVSYAALSLWAHGTRPNYWMLVYLYQHSAGYLREIARALLAEQKPDVWGSNGHSQDRAAQNAG